MERINHSVINWYELSLDKESQTAELKRYNRPATACDKPEIFVQKISAERYHKLAQTFVWFGYFHETEWAEWYGVGVKYPGDEQCYRTGELFRI